MTRTHVALCLGLVQMVSACGHQPVTQDRASVHTVQISEVVTPNVLYAAPGEEVRWTNLRSNPIRLGFLSMRLLGDVKCDHGVRTLFGVMSDLVTIPPGESVSICFVRRGDLKYNVWLEPDNPRGPITPTATIRVDSGG
ncbi:hypothetical protein ACO9S2_14195 [Nitrospira sp. NS4]|uniref:hypothetical protein n=1 Tax=Nitrospira sp. NS4 TaxID=3414498 RepID=UPI003C306357